MTARRWVSSIVTAAVALSSTAHAQSGSRASSFGVKAGGVLASLGGEDRQQLTQSRRGFAVGGFLSLGLAPSFALQPEVFLVQKGGKGEDSGVSGNVKASLLEVPLLLKISAPAHSGRTVSPYLVAGPALAFRTGCRWTVTDGTTTLSEDCDDAQVRIKSTDVSVLFGAGAELGRVILELRYDLGLRKLGDVGAGQDDVKTRAVSLQVGWAFRL